MRPPALVHLAVPNGGGSGHAQYNFPGHLRRVTISYRGRVLAPDWELTALSLMTSMDGGRQIDLRIPPGRPTGLWDKVSHRGGGDSGRYHLACGRHTPCASTIGKREPN